MDELFEKHNDEYLKFERIVNKRSMRPDLHAFLLLDELFSGTRDIVSSASHDEIYIDCDYDDVEKLTEEQVVELIRCGVMYEDGSLAMGV